MYLAILLIAVSILVFYNEFNKHMNFAEIAILAISLIAIIKASMNYMMLDTSVKEGFTNNINRSRKNGIKNKGKNNKEDIIILESNKSDDYLDTDSINNSFENSDDNMDKSSDGKIDSHAVNKIDSVLSSKGNLDSMMQSSKSNFYNLPDPEPTNTTTDNQDMESLFAPKIVIGKSTGNSSNRRTRASGTLLDGSSMNCSQWDSSYKDDGMTFSNSMKPTHNLWEDNLDYMDNSINWSQSLDAYNKGKWNPNLYKKPSDYTDYYAPSSRGESNTGAQSATGSATGSRSTTGRTTITEAFQSTSNASPTPTTLDSNGQSQRLCGAYDDLSMDQAGNLVVRNYTEAKKWYPGYTYVPPVYWDVPQRHVSICQPNGPNVRKLTGLIDRGLPINALELNPDGSIADNERDVKLTNVGSVLPKFNYIEEPYSKPYV